MSKMLKELWHYTPSRYIVLYLVLGAPKDRNPARYNRELIRFFFTAFEHGLPRGGAVPTTEMIRMDFLRITPFEPDYRTDTAELMRMRGDEGEYPRRGG